MQRVFGEYDPPAMYNVFAYARFDMKNKEPISYHTDELSFIESLQSHLPDATLGYQDNITASDVFDIIREYLETSPNLCGSSIIIAAKRYPNEVEQLDDLIYALRRNHISIYITAIDTPNGGTNMQSLFDVSSKTNGLCVISADPNLSDSVFRFRSYLLVYPYQLKSSNLMADGIGNETVSFEITEKFQNLFIMVTYMNHKYEDNVDSLNYTLTDSNGKIIMAQSWLPGNNDGRQMFMLQTDVNGISPYYFTVNYSYTWVREELMEIRINTELYENNDWPPYDN